jgi:hypothetical protein
MTRNGSLRILGVSGTLLASTVLASAQRAPSQFGTHGALWTYTTPSHLSLYGALAGQPIYREEIRGTALHPDRVIVAVVPPGHAGLHLICLSRRGGSEVWRRELPGEVSPMAWDLPTMNDRVFIPLYDSSQRRVAIAAVDLVSGALLWRRDAEITLNRYQYGDILDVDAQNGVLELYLPEKVHNNRVTVSVDGSQVRHSSYRMYFWPVGARRYGNLIFGFDGEPLSMTATALVALDENTGAVRWRVPTSSGHWTSPPVVVNDLLVFAAKTALIALDLPSGQRRWSVTLQGLVPPHPAPAFVANNYIMLTQQMHGKAPPRADWIFTRHLVSTGAERGVVLVGERPVGPKFMRRIGPFLGSQGDVWLDIVDPATPAVHTSTSFEGTFSRFVFATPRVSLGSADDRGFLVVTSDGKLRYYEVPVPEAKIPVSR